MWIPWEMTLNWFCLHKGEVHNLTYFQLLLCFVLAVMFSSQPWPDTAFAYLLLDFPLAHLHPQTAHETSNDARFRTTQTHSHSTSMSQFTSSPASCISVVSSEWYCDAIQKPHSSLLPHYISRYWASSPNRPSSCQRSLDHPNIHSYIEIYSSATLSCQAKSRHHQGSYSSSTWTLTWREGQRPGKCFIWTDNIVCMVPSSLTY